MDSKTQHHILTLEYKNGIPIIGRNTKKYPNMIGDACLFKKFHI